MSEKLQTRIQLICEALGINQTQAYITNELIKEVPDEKLLEFFAYRLKFVEPMRSGELITKMAVFEYKKHMTLKAIRADKFRFKSISEVIEFIQTFFKNQRLCYGLGGYKEFVIIGVDESGNLINHYNINQYGKPSRLSSDDEASIYLALWQNQHRIGDIKFISDKDRASLIAKHDKEADERVRALDNALLDNDPDRELKIDPKTRELLRQRGLK